MSIRPTMIVENNWGELPPIEPVSKLRPEPLKDVLLIVGDSAGVWEDVAGFRALGVKHDVMLLNHAALGYPFRYQHYVAGDSHMADMQAIAKIVPERVIKHCWNPNSFGFDVRWLKMNRAGWSGTTANLAIKIAVILGYLKIVLAGVPMDFSGHWYDEFLPPDDRKRQSDHRHHLWKWNELACRPQARLMRSMSGNTKDNLGEPTKEWLLDIPIPLNGGSK